MTSRSHTLSGWRRTLLMALVLAGGALQSLSAAGPSAVLADGLNECEVKAALLFNFAKFVEWPPAAFPSANAPFVIGIIGSDPVGPALERLLAGKTVAGRAIVIRRWRRASERGDCQLLFVSGSEQSSLKRLLHDIDQQPVLTVADMGEFAARGGMIGLIVKDRRLCFEINTEGTDRAHLKISSRLLSLAHIVSDTP